MTVEARQNPFPHFTDTAGSSLEAGYVYFGVANQDPRQYPVSVFYDRGLTIPATQPLRTTAGYLYRNGSPVNVYMDGSCSVLVLDSAQRQVSYAAEWIGTADTAAAAAQGYATAAQEAQAAAETAQAAVEAALLSVSKSLLLLVAGQSNACRRSPRVTFSYDPKLICFSGANETTDRTDGLGQAGPLPASVFASTIPFSEFGNDKESCAPGFAAADTEYSRILTHTPARAGFHYRLLMTGQGAWSDLENAMRYGRSLLVADGYSTIDTVVLWDNGEADASGTAPDGITAEGPITSAQTVEILTDLVANVNRSAAIAHKVPGYTAPVICTQMCFSAGAAYRNLQSGQVAAARSVSGFYLAGPRYAYTHESDGIHLASDGKRLMYEYVRYRLSDIQAGNGLPVHIVSATRAANVVTATFNTINGNLVIDTTNVPDTAASYPGSLYGFEYYYSGAQIGVTNVSVSGKVATITLASTPAGAGELRYGQMTWPGGALSVSGPTSKLARGCIRDSGSHVSVSGTSLYNWACHQTIATN